MNRKQKEQFLQGFIDDQKKRLVPILGEGDIPHMEMEPFAIDKYLNKNAFRKGVWIVDDEFPKWMVCVYKNCVYGFDSDGVWGINFMSKKDRKEMVHRFKANPNIRVATKSEYEGVLIKYITEDVIKKMAEDHIFYTNSLVTEEVKNQIAFSTCGTEIMINGFVVLRDGIFDL